MALMILLPLPQIEIDSGLSALCTMPCKKRFFDCRQISRVTWQNSASLGSNFEPAPDGIVSMTLTHPSFEMSPVGWGDVSVPKLSLQYPLKGLRHRHPPRIGRSLIYPQYATWQGPVPRSAMCQSTKSLRDSLRWAAYLNTS